MATCLVLQYVLAADIAQRIEAGEHPSTEIVGLAVKLKAEIIDLRSAAQSRNILVRAGFLLWQPLGPILLAWWRRREFDSVYVTNEKQGLLIAALFKLLKRRPRLIVFNHNLSNPKKALLFNALKLETSTDALICLNKFQARFLETELGVPQEKVFTISWGVDGAFFRPQIQGKEEHHYILSVGREGRDYPTLFTALHDTSIRAKVLSSGYLPISTKYQNKTPRAVQDNVEMYSHISYVEMRQFYNDCSFVVVPLLHDFNSPAGVTVIVEAMAMGKAVIASHSRGIDEFIEDTVTGFWVEPGNPMMLREKILSLWENPKMAEQVGARAREC